MRIQDYSNPYEKGSRNMHFEKMFWGRKRQKLKKKSNDPSMSMPKEKEQNKANKVKLEIMSLWTYLGLMTLWTHLRHS